MLCKRVPDEHIYLSNIFTETITILTFKDFLKYLFFSNNNNRIPVNPLDPSSTLSTPPQPSLNTIQ